MEENEQINGDTYKISVNFIVDVPRYYDDSIINTIVLGLNEYMHIKNESSISQKRKNELLMNIQREIDSLIILDE